VHEADADTELEPYWHTFAKFREFDSLDLFVSTLRTDRVDGLFSTVVCDESRACLGLVYSNTQTLRLAFFRQRGIYYSRSRQEVWFKGESSGMVQTLISIRADCDGDAIQMIVRQHGHLDKPPSFCHLNRRSCFGDDQGFGKLERVLMNRLLHAPEGSYTKRLYQDEKLLQQKLLEEVQELIEAQDKDHIASEAADVIYFLMVRCVAAGVSVADIEQNLDKKSLKLNRRPGNAKEWRTRDAEQVLMRVCLMCCDLVIF
jgi:phosphoribosyl-ATP pyrophosphohydrolase / phosphoribosyl-AMP cyclohydrolase / histidinol dehydrogenase